MLQEHEDPQKPALAPGAGQPAASLVDIIRKARDIVAELTGLPVDSVSGCTRENGQWQATVDVVESPARLGDNDMLATYEVLLNETGEIAGFTRTARYNRTDAAGRG